MSFWGKRFIFDSIPSERYSLVMTSGDGESSISNASGNVELITQDVFRRPIPYLLGVKPDKPLQLTASITTTNGEITIEDARLIQKWLFSHLEYKKLHIVQTDMPDYYFNCILTDPKIRRVGNIIRGFDFTIQCDSPFGGWGNTVTESLEKTDYAYNVVKETNGDGFLYSYTETSQTKTIYNLSDSPDYNYPIIKIYMKDDFTGYFTEDSVTTGYPFSGWVKIINKTDNNREFFFGESLGVSPIKKADSTLLLSPYTSLMPSEILTVDNDLQMISTSETYDSTVTNSDGTISITTYPYNRLSIMGEDKKFFRLLPKTNELIITGNYKKIEFIYNPIIRIA